MYAAETPAPSGNPTIVWSVINDYGSATISATGLLTPKTMGSVRVTATDGVGSNSTYTINIVHPAVYSPVLTSLTVNDSGWARASDNNNVTMYYGSTHQLDIKAYDQYGASMAIPNLILTDYTDPNKPVVITTVTISPSGLVTAPQANVATRPVMYYLGISAVNSNGATIVASLLYNSTVPGANKFYLTIYKTPPAVQSIKLACSNNVQPDTIMVGRTQDCYASDQTTAPVYGKCSSDNPSVSVKSVSDPVSQFQNYLVPSTVHYNGPGECLITGVSTGAATITMSFNGITSNAWQVNVVSLTCPTGQLLCGNTCCVNSSFTCQSGQCVLKPQTVCPTGETQCANGSGCCNTYTNPSLNPNGNINTQTPSQMCSAGEMPCATYCIPGSACVNGACVTTSDHVAGQCNPACKSGQFCYQGVCGYVNSGSVNTPLTTGPCSPSALGSTSGSSFASTSSAGIANNTSNNTGTGTNNNSSCNTGTFACGSTCCTNAQTCFHGACVAGGASGACPAQEYSCGSNYACCALNQVCYLNSYCLNASQYPASSCTPACGQGQICYYGTCQSVTSNSADSNTSTSGTSSKSASVSASGATSNQAQSADNSALIAQLQEEIQSLMKQIQQIIAARSAK